MASFSCLLRAMRKFLAVIKQVFSVGCANILLCLPVSLARLTVHYRVLQKAQVVVVMLYPSGFGHTITGPDVTRRLFPDRRCVFIVLSQNSRHNWKVASIWPDSDVFFVRFKFIFGIPNVKWARQIAVRIINLYIRIVVGSQVLLISPSLWDLYARIPIPDTLKSSIQHLSRNYRWPIGYFKLQQEVAAPPVKLPLKWRDNIRRKLNRVMLPANHGSRTRLCGLYLRQKGVNSEDITGSRRVGSPLENYLPAIRQLNRVGYQVLLTGDVSLDSSLYDEFDGMLVDAKNLGIDKEWFALYAATEPDIFIGEAGGGTHLPGLNGIPRLLVNAFPYFLGIPNSWIHYKTVRDQEGKLVPYTKLFSDHAYDYGLEEGMALHNNSAEEIYEAVSCFIADVSRAEEADPNAHIVAQLPDHTWIKHCTNARLSPAWLKLYDDES